MVAVTQVVEKIGEGARFQESELPIDISYAKLAEWLVDRKKISPDWRKRLGVIQQKKALALKTLPRDVDTWLLTCSEESTGYLESKRIRDILAAAKPEARTLFGRLSGAAGDWDVIVRLYEKDNVFLGEASHIMVQNTNYEIPFLRRQVGKWNQQVADLGRKEADYRRNAAASGQKFKQTCEDLGIQGKDIKKELLALTGRLPGIFKEVSDAICTSKVEEAVGYYQSYVAYAHTEAGVEPQTVVPTLVELQLKPPGDAELSSMEKAFAAMARKAGEKKEGGRGEKALSETAELSIDWDMGLAASPEAGPDAAPVEISWDVGELDLSEAAQDASINWDVVDDTTSVPREDTAIDAVADGHKEGDDEQRQVILSVEPQGDGDAELSIKWDIDVTEGSGGLGEMQIDWDIGMVEEVGASDAKDESQDVTIGVAQGGGSGDDDVAVSEVPAHPLSTVEYRNLLINDLFELRAFLGQRKLQLSSGECSAMIDQLQAGAPMAIQQHGVESLEAMDQEVARSLNLLTCERTQNLIMIATSTRFLERMEKSVLEKKTNQRKLLEGVAEIDKKRVEVRNLLSATFPKHDGTLKRTRELKAMVEKMISAQYGGRPVNVIGEINNVLGQG